MHLQTFHIMADIHIDIERMIMHSNYLLEVDNSSASNGLSVTIYFSILPAKK